MTLISYECWKILFPTSRGEKPNDDNNVALRRQISDSLSDASGEDDDDDDNNANDNEDVEGDETESEEDLHKADNASLLPKETAMQCSQQVSLKICLLNYYRDILGGFLRFQFILTLWT